MDPKTLGPRVAHLENRLSTHFENDCIEMLSAADPFICDRPLYEKRLKAMSDRTGENYTANTVAWLRRLLGLHLKPEGLAKLDTVLAASVAQ